MSTMFFSVKSIGMSGYGGRKKCTLMEAARHNLREIQAEQGAKGHIDPARIHRNVLLDGPSTAAEVVELSKKLTNEADVDFAKLRKDFCHAYELVFSLPEHGGIDSRSYFANCLEWSRQAYGLPVLLATIHCDEATRHLHVLLLPLKDREYVGCKLLAPASTMRLRDSFFRSVAGPAGLKRENAKFRGIVKQWAVAAVLRECEVRSLPVMTGALWPVFKAAIECDPTEAVRLLNIDVESLRPKEDGSTGAPSIPIGFDPQPSKTQNLSRVGFPTEKVPSKRLNIARDAERRALDRHTKKKSESAMSTVEQADEDGLIRVRDADFDPAIWAERA
jgi:Plasmid recombination enzyme